MFEIVSSIQMDITYCQNKAESIINSLLFNLYSYKGLKPLIQINKMEWKEHIL